MIFELGFAITAILVSAPASSIDTLVESAQRSAGVEAALPCDDDTFLRRATLDIIGRIPTREELEHFRRNPDRTRLVERLLAAPEFPRFWSEIWTAAAVGYGNLYGADRELLRRWWETQIADAVPYDAIARALLTAEGASAINGPVNFLLRYPDEPVTKVCRLFLGVRLECARCHDHPFDRWTRDDFDGMNRFFEVVEREELSEGNLRIRDRLPEVEESELPRFLTGARPRTRRWREELAHYLTRSKPFARAYVNRLWYHFMGRGIVEPVDDFNRENPPSIPRLLEFLRTQAVQRQFQLRPLIRTICLSRTYQQASESTSPDEQRARLFAYYRVKPLTAVQVFDSVRVVLELPADSGARRAFLREMSRRSLDDDFSATWEYRETVQDLLRKLTHRQEVPHRPLDHWFQLILTRDPRPDEVALCKGRSDEEIVFALLMGSEFAFNH